MPRRLRAHRVAQGAPLVQAPLQRRFGGQAALQREAGRRVEFVVEEGVQPEIVVGVHESALVADGEMGRNASASRLRPRDRRDITVPMGTSVMRAMSR